VIRDKWSGVFVEPLPYSFEHLQNNYRYLRNPDLVFVNAAVVVSEQSDMAFWTFHEDFLAGLSEEEKINHLQKSSFKREHVIGFLGADVDTEQAIVEVHVPCLTLSELASRYLPSPNITLLITDCEGYESTLIPSIDFRDIAPEAILYESHNLGEQESVVGCFLANNGYQVFQMGGDTFAIQEELLARWRKSDAWIEEGLEAPDFSVGTERIGGHSIPGGGL
jgi:FkbM family methyltransferase